MNKPPFIDARDVFMLLGLSSLGAGLFFWYGLGPALTSIGAIITALSIFGK